MPSRRAQITLSEQEQAEWLAGRHTLQVASNGPKGYPHLVAMWYAVIDGEIHFTTFGKSQKVLNLRRDPRITCMLESGDEYSELRGLVIEGTAEIIEDTALVLKVLSHVNAQRSGTKPLEPEPDSAKQAPKRVAIRVKPDRIFTWDHTKLGGRR